MEYVTPCLSPRMTNTEVELVAQLVPGRRRGEVFELAGELVRGWKGSELVVGGLLGKSSRIRALVYR